MRASLGTKHIKLLETATVKIDEVINNEARQETVTLVEASARMASKAFVISETPVASVNLINDDVFFVMKNAQGHFLKQLNHSSNLFESSMTSQVSKICKLCSVCVYNYVYLICADLVFLQLCWAYS